MFSQGIEQDSDNVSCEPSSLDAGIPLSSIVGLYIFHNKETAERWTRVSYCIVGKNICPGGRAYCIGQGFVVSKVLFEGTEPQL